jgi:hypothetical protein
MQMDDRRAAVPYRPRAVTAAIDRPRTAATAR